jgi:hypothetical protein
MRLNSLSKILRERYRRNDEITSHGKVLETKLIASYRNRYSRKRWTMNGRPIFNRSYVLMAMLTITLLSIGACTIPTQYEAELGKSISITLDQSDMGPELKSAIDHVMKLDAVESANVNVRMTPDGGIVDLTLWGKSLDTDAMIANLRREYPIFADAEFSVQPLNTIVEAPLYERIGHDFFGMDFEIVVEGQTEEEIRQSILEQLYASGFEGEANVDVHMEQEDGMEKIEITIETDDTEGEQ